MCDTLCTAMAENIIMATWSFDDLMREGKIPSWESLSETGGSSAAKDAIIQIAEDFEEKYKNLDWNESELDYNEEIENFSRQKLLEKFGSDGVGDMNKKRQINITDQSICCCDDFDVCDDMINIPYELWFDVDKYFGTNTKDSDAFINFYTFYHKDGSISAAYDVDYPDHTESVEWDLTDDEKAFFKGMMEQYCFDKVDCSLSELAKELLGDD